MADYKGKDWFRSNLSPYLTKIKAEIAGSGGGGGNSYAPVVFSQSKTNIGTGINELIILQGEFFYPDTTYTSSQATITNVNYLGTGLIEFTINTSIQGNLIVTIDNSAGTLDINFNADTLNAGWTDLRLNSGSTTTITNKTGTTLTRDSEGLISSGSNWSNWYQVDSHSWQRSVLKNVSILMKVPTSAFMAGIRGNEADDASNNQYQQFEIQSYFPNSYQWGFYGTNAAHGSVNQSIPNGSTSFSLSGYSYIRMEYLDNGQPGSIYKLYGLNSLTDFDDISNLIGQATIGSTFTCDSTTLYVGATTGNTNQRMVAFKIEDA